MTGRPATKPRRAKAPPRCPICGRPRDPEFRPFCSKRCKQVDLARWMNEVYAVPAVEPGDEEDEV